MEEMIRQAAADHEIPADLLRDVLLLEQDKVTLQNRRLTPRILEVIAKYAAEMSETSRNG